MPDSAEEIKQNTDGFCFFGIKTWLKKAWFCKGNKEQNYWLLIEFPRMGC